MRRVERWRAERTLRIGNGLVGDTVQSARLAAEGVK